MQSIQNTNLGGGGIGSDQAIFRILDESLTFTNLVATVSDARITADDAVLVFYANEAVAESAGITATWADGSVTFTATSTPSSTVVVTIYVIKPALANVWDNISANEVSYSSGTVKDALDIFGRINYYTYNIAGNVPTATEMAAVSATINVTGTIIIQFFNTLNNNSCTFFGNAVGKDYAGGIITSYYSSKWYKVHVMAGTATLTAF